MDLLHPRPRFQTGHIPPPNTAKPSVSLLPHSPGHKIHSPTKPRPKIGLRSSPGEPTKPRATQNVKFVGNSRTVCSIAAAPERTRLGATLRGELVFGVCSSVGARKRKKGKTIFEARGKGILDQSSQFEVTSECLDLVPTT
jgi:hypothetical protein